MKMLALVPLLGVLLLAMPRVGVQGVEGEVAGAGPVLTGRVIDEQGRAVKGAKVRLYSGLATRWPGQEAETGPDGVYRFDPLETGAMTLRGEGEEKEAFYFIGVRLEHVTHASDEQSAWWDIEVPIRAGHVATRDFALIPGGRLEGRVLTPAGFGWGELSLRGVPLNPEHRNSTGWYAETDHRGRFALEAALTPGEYAVQWNCPGAGFAELGRVKIEPGALTTARIQMRVTVSA